jgi:hypothetical protein
VSDQPKQDWISTTAWTEDTPDLEGDDVEVRAELSDVDEVVLRIAYGDRDTEQVLIHVDCLHAIALAGQLAKAATEDLTTLPKGHGAGGPLG